MLYNVTLLVDFLIQREPRFINEWGLKNLEDEELSLLNFDSIQVNIDESFWKDLSTLIQIKKSDKTKESILKFLAPSKFIKKSSGLKIEFRCLLEAEPENVSERTNKIIEMLKFQIQNTWGAENFDIWGTDLSLKVKPKVKISSTNIVVQKYLLEAYQKDLEQRTCSNNFCKSGSLQ